jgi:hypothetical protein
LHAAAPSVSPAAAARAIDRVSNCICPTITRSRGRRHQLSESAACARCRKK